MFHIFDIDEHLDSDEKVLMFFRPSRFAYLFQYCMIVLIFVFGFAMWIIFTNDYRISAAFARNIGQLLIIFSIIWFIRVEYRIWSRRYALTTERLMYSRGILSEYYQSASYKYITDISFQQSLWDKILNTGTIDVNTAGTDNYEFKYRKVDSPLKIKRVINDMQNQVTSLKNYKKKNVDTDKEDTEENK